MGGGGFGDSAVYSPNYNPTYAGSTKEKYVDPKTYSYIGGDSWQNGMWGGGSWMNQTAAGPGSAGKKFKAGEKAGRYGPGQYDYYVATDEFNDKGFQKLVQYGASKIGKPIVDEARAKEQRDRDLISGFTLELEKRKNEQLSLKNGAGVGAPGKAKKQKQTSLLTNGPLETDVSLLGGASARSLLGG